MSMTVLLDFLSYGPILRGFIALIAAGIAFPCVGVFVLRLNLIPLRFALMHGALLGGALALALGVDPLFCSVLIVLILILIIPSLSGISGLPSGYVTAFLMVTMVGIAFAVIYKAHVPAQDAFSIFWGNLYALSRFDLYFTAAFSLGILAFVFFFFRQITAIFFHRDIAFTVGVHERALSSVILLVTGITVAFAMRLIGALLLDSLLLLPAITAMIFAKSTRTLFLGASISGMFSAVVGFVISVTLDLPASSSVTLGAVLILCIAFLIHRRRTK